MNKLKLKGIVITNFKDWKNKSLVSFNIIINSIYNTFLE